MQTIEEETKSTVTNSTDANNQNEEVIQKLKDELQLMQF